MAQHPLTHHEILELAEPFVRRGIHVDLRASDRMARQLSFRTVDRAATSDGVPATTESLRLENPVRGAFRLTRTLRAEPGLEATLIAEGDRPDTLLAGVEAVPPGMHWQPGDGYLIARTFELSPGDLGLTPDSVIARLRLTRAVIVAAGARAIVEVPERGRGPAEIRFEPAADASIDTPEDLFAVLGRAWSPLRRAEFDWRGTLRLPPPGPRRDDTVPRRLEVLAEHLARTLHEPPGRFHDRHRSARWRVALRRAEPITVSIALIALTAALPKLGIGEDSMARMLIFNAPPILLMLVFCMRELPRFEIPPLPRRESAPAWRGTALATDRSTDVETV
jgi:hypothetical protein